MSLHRHIVRPLKHPQATNSSSYRSKARALNPLRPPSNMHIMHHLLILIMLIGMYRNTLNIYIYIELSRFSGSGSFQDTQTKQSWNVHILMYPTKCSKLIDPLWHLMTISISLDPFNPLSILHLLLPSGWSPFWKAPSPTPEALPPMACATNLTVAGKWKNMKKLVKVKEPCSVWGLNSAALVHYVDRSWHSICMKLHERWRSETV